MKTEFELTLYADRENSRDSSMLSKLELAFDDIRNPIPDSYYKFVENLPYGGRFRVVFEVLE
jgi:hypothetical protein